MKIKFYQLLTIAIIISALLIPLNAMIFGIILCIFIISSLFPSLLDCTVINTDGD
jgi:hypothetical protein